VSIAPWLREIGRGRDGTRALTRDEAASLFGHVLDRTVGDLEIGAFCIAMRVKGETAAEMNGFLDAAESRIGGWPRSTDPARPVIVLPSYNGARRLPVLTPLLALLLARRGWPVLLHGMRSEARRVLASEVLALLGIHPGEGAAAIAPGQVGTIATGSLHPGLARLLSVRESIGLRNSGHSVVKLLAPPGAVLVTGYTHAEYAETMHAVCRERGLTALLSRGLEGEPAADPRRTPRYDAFLRGTHRLAQAQEPGTAAEVPGLPQTIDADATARWTERVLDSRAPMPAGLARQVDLVVELAGAAAG
jgi:anthranilate phosphoribosyltransferase